MFELNQMEQLIMVAECGTLAGAAKKLHLSQPALSRSMQKLEEELQVPLFNRKKNKIQLNQNGELAVEYARKLVWQAQDMVNSLQTFDRKQRTILIGSCAPAPLWELVPILSRLYPDMTVSSEIRENRTLLQGVKNGTYQLAILPFAVKEEGISCKKYGEEHLYFSLPPTHPLSGSKALHLKDLNGETMLLWFDIGFWKRVEQKMPDTHFLVQNEAYAFDQLVKASALPTFTTDRALNREGHMPNRVEIPILDEEANVSYYLIYLTKSRKNLENFLKTLPSDS